jgi:pyruvate kinase
VNVPDVALPVPALSPKDRRDLDFAMTLDVDWVALSFVQRPDDVAETKKIVAGRAAVMAKIEKPRALDFLDEIIEVADGIMVARGDLGVELPIEQVPGIQKAITRAARIAGKPVVVATQMLESMIEAPVPTRAEVSDVANAVFEGADAVMLSGESAAGAHPLESVEMMDRVARSVESDPQFRDAIDAGRTDPETTSADAITLAARQVAETLKAAAIVCYTASGSTGLRASRERPKVPILVLTPVVQTARRLALAWGVHCVETEDTTSFLDMVIRASRVAETEEFAKVGDRLVITAGVPFGTPGRTNILRIATVGTEARRPRS